MDNIVRQADPDVSNSIWRNTNFLLLYFTGTIINLGSRIYELALPLIIYEITKSSVVMGTMRAVEFLPNLLLAMFIGVWVDRTNRKRFMQISILVQVIVLFSLFTFIQNGLQNEFIFYVSGFILMTSIYGYNNSRSSIIKTTIPKEHLLTANAKFTFTVTLIGLMGPALSGFILMFTELQYGLLVTGIAFLIGLIISCFIQSDDHITSPKKSSTVWNDLREGWVMLRKNEILWKITLLVIFTNAAESMFSAMLVFYAKNTLHLTQIQVGIVLSCAGIGGLIGSYIIEYLSKKFTVGKILGVSILLVGIAYFIMFFATNIYVMGLSILLEAAFGTIYVVTIMTVRQETTESHLIGRITGITGSLFKLAMPIAIFSSGWISMYIGTSYVFCLSAFIQLIIFLVYTYLKLWKVS
ncbi:TPA: MFS transporter [Bacillus tropicus]|nr:MFS transporter [Bacillus tropicus]